MSNRTYQHFIIATVSFVLAVTGCVFFLHTIMGQRVLLEEQLANISETQSQEIIFFQLRRLAEETTNERAQLTEYFLPSVNDSIRLLALIEGEWAIQSGVEVETMRLEPVTEEPHDWIEMSFEITGSAAAVRTYIQVLERIPYRSRVERITLTNQDAGNSAATVELRVGLLPE